MEFCQASPSESEAVQVTLLHTGCKIAELFKRPGHIVRTIRKEPVKHNSIYMCSGSQVYIIIRNSVCQQANMYASHEHTHACTAKKKSSFI